MLKKISGKTKQTVKRIPETSTRKARNGTRISENELNVPKIRFVRFRVFRQFRVRARFRFFQF